MRSLSQDTTVILNNKTATCEHLNKRVFFSATTEMCNYVFNTK